jgi:60 kDa SS-A/Ro ribonucleoprotein
MAGYGFMVGNRSPQSLPILGREKEMRENLAGGYGFKADWIALRRWLLTGSMFDAFYQTRFEMTMDNIKLLKELLSEDPARVGSEILDASKKGVSVHTPILALVILSTGTGEAKKVFRELFSQVIRNGSHLYEFFSYIRGIRGFGILIHQTVKDWLKNKDVKELEYQFLKYQGRYGWTGRDILRMIKPIPDSDEKCALFKWIAGKMEDMAELPEILKRIRIYETLKRGVSEEEVVTAIKTFNLTWEMIPANIERTPAVWEAIFQKMPVTASIRNLGNLTDKGIFTKIANLDLLEARLSKENLEKAYVHPVVLASAYKIYKNGGRLGKSKLGWAPVPRIEDILENAIEASFQVLKPTGYHFYHALDVSGSMVSATLGTMWLSPLEVEGIMALATIRAEKNYFVGGFSDDFCPLSMFRKGTTFSDATDHTSYVWPRDFGGTNASSAYNYAIKNRTYTDLFVFWTDNESWEGRSHPAQVLAEYRRKINPGAKAVYITLVPYGDQTTLVDPKDPKSFDIAGFTSETPKLIQMIADGSLIGG